MALGRKYALITGSSRGIGRGIALALAENGVKVAIHYYQNEAAAKDTLAQVRERGSDGLLVQADVTDPAQITDIFHKLKNEFGKLDIFVSNARPEAPTFFQPPLDITLQQWDMAFDSQAKAFLVAAARYANRAKWIATSRVEPSAPELHGQILRLEPLAEKHLASLAKLVDRKLTKAQAAEIAKQGGRSGRPEGRPDTWLEDALVDRHCRRGGRDHTTRDRGWR